MRVLQGGPKPLPPPTKGWWGEAGKEACAEVQGDSSPGGCSQEPVQKEAGSKIGAFGVIPRISGKSGMRRDDFDSDLLLLIMSCPHPLCPWLLKEREEESVL